MANREQSGETPQMMLSVWVFRGNGKYKRWEAKNKIPHPGDNTLLAPVYRA
jgi:hypothetical protein